MFTRSHIASPARLLSAHTPPSLIWHFIEVDWFIREVGNSAGQGNGMGKGTKRRDWRMSCVSLVERRRLGTQLDWSDWSRGCLFPLVPSCRSGTDRCAVLNTGVLARCRRHRRRGWLGIGYAYITLSASMQNIIGSHGTCLLEM